MVIFFKKIIQQEEKKNRFSLKKLFYSCELFTEGHYSLRDIKEYRLYNQSNLNFDIIFATS